MIQPIPTSVQVGSLVVKIRLVKQPRLDDGTKVFGYYNGQRCEIQIQRSLSLQRQWITLMHELQHAAVDSADADVDLAEAIGAEAAYRIEHTFIRCCTSEFLGALRTMGWLKFPGEK